VHATGTTAVSLMSQGTIWRPLVCTISLKRRHVPSKEFCLGMFRPTLRYDANQSKAVLDLISFLSHFTDR